VGAAYAARRNPITLGNPQVEFTETSLAADGQRLPSTIKLSNDGFAFAMSSLIATCPPVKNPSALQAVGLPSNATK
jgi:hypothetical protein